MYLFTDILCYGGAIHNCNIRYLYWIPIELITSAEYEAVNVGIGSTTINVQKILYVYGWSYYFVPILIKSKQTLADY